MVDQKHHCLISELLHSFRSFFKASEAFKTLLENFRMGFSFRPTCFHENYFSTVPFESLTVNFKTCLLTLFVSIYFQCMTLKYLVHLIFFEFHILVLSCNKCKMKWFMHCKAFKIVLSSQIKLEMKKIWIFDGNHLESFWVQHDSEKMEQFLLKEYGN